MTEINPTEKTIYYEAAGIADLDRRSAYLAVVCKGNDDLRNRVQSLLDARAAAGSFLDSPPVESVIGSGPADNNKQLEPTADKRIGPYKLLEQIGEGGFGIVYMADQTEPVRRRVALKIIKAGMDTKQVIARFEAERQVLALMDHPNIAKVLDAGATEDGRPYFVMELVRGVPINEHCDDRNLSTDERLRLFIEICSAVQHAHQKGIIHRDIKPTNILVYSNGDRPVARIIDFGIAKATQGRLTDKTPFTHFRQFIGTPAYMSPEQAQMSGADIDTRSDIYSLGVVLFELLTGKTPLDSQDLAHAGVEEICRRIREEKAPTPSKKISSQRQDELKTLAQNRRTDPAAFCALIRGDLDWIVMKAMEKDRSRRYDSASALAEDVGRFLRREPVSAVPPSASYLARKFVHRNRGPLAVAGAIATTFVAAAIVSSWQAFSATRARNRLADEVLAKEIALDRALTAEKAALAGQLQARQVAYLADMNSAHQALQLNNLQLARALRDRYLAFPDGNDLRNWEWRALWLQCRSDAVAILSDQAVFRGISPEGKWLASLAGRIEIQIQNLSTGEIRTLARPNTFRQQGSFVVFAPSGDQVYATAASGLVKSWSLPLLSESPAELRHGSRIRHLCISHDGSLMAMFGFDQQVSLWELSLSDSAPKPTMIYAGSGEGIGEIEGNVAISPDNKLLAIGLAGRTRLVDLETLRERAVIPLGGKWALTFSPDGQYLAIGASIMDSTAYLYRIADAELMKLEGHTRFVTDVDFSPDSRLLATASADQTVRLWDTETRTEVDVLRGHTNEVKRVEFTGDGATLISGGHDRQILLWNAHPRSSSDWPITVEEAVPGYESWYSRVSFSSDGRYLATRNRDDDTVSLRSPKTLEEIRGLPELGTNNRGVHFSPVKLLLAAGSADGSIVFINPDVPNELTRVELAPDADISPLGFSGDGEQLLVFAQAASGSSCIICSVPAGRQLRRWAIPPDALWAALSPDSELVATAHSDRTTRIWRIADPSEPLAELRRPSNAVTFSPDGSTLLTGAISNAIEMWDVETLSTVDRLRGKMTSVAAIAFSPDGTRVAAGGGSGEPVMIWDVATRRELMTLHVDGFWFRHLEWSPDGNAILAIGGTGDLHLWRVTTLEEIEALEGQPGKSRIELSSSWQPPT